MDLERTGARFQTTCWTLVRAAAHEGPEQQAALGQLVHRTWPAVYGYLRRSGLSRDRAAETTQAFFADVVLPRHIFEQADPARGRLRALLMSALKRYLIDVHRRACARGGERAIPAGAFDQQERILASADPREAPESSFERSWATAQLEEALRRAEAHFRENGRERHWSLFEARVLGPALRDYEPPLLADMAERLGFCSPADASAAVQTVKRRFHDILREVVAETVACEEDIDDELARLRLVLA